MTDAGFHIEPPAPPIHAQPLSTWRLIVTAFKNPLAAYSTDSFQSRCSRVSVLGRNTLTVNHPDGVKHVLTKHAERYRRPVSVIRSVRWVMGDGLFLAEGQAWRKQRRLLAPLFSPAHVGELLPHFVGAGQSLLTRLDGQSEVNLSSEFNESTLDAVLRALFSSPAHTGGKDLARLTRYFLEGPGRPNVADLLARAEDDFPLLARKRRRFRDGWHSAVESLIEKRRDGSGSRSSRDLLDILLTARDPQSGASLSSEEVRDQTATMLFAGFETTTRLLFWAAYLLALSQEEQEALRDEVSSFPPERVQSLNDLQNWPRLRCVLFEALRLYPPIPQIIRQAVEADEVLGEKVDPGDLVWISPWTLHRHQEHWDQPTRFIPKRFAGQTQPWTQGAFVPFGSGPRICIGASFAMAEAQILLATLLQRYRIGLIDTRPVLPIGLTSTLPNYEPKFSLAAVPSA